MTEVFPDRNGVVRNVEVKVAPRFKGSGQYKSQVLYKLKRHISNLIVIVPAEEVDNDKKAENIQKEITV